MSPKCKKIFLIVTIAGSIGETLPLQKAEKCFPCGSCKLGFATADALAKHSQIRHPHALDGTKKKLPKFFCDKCDFAKADKKAFYNHRRRAHRTQNARKCDDCGGSFPNRYFLLEHQRYACPLASERLDLEPLRCFHCLMQSRTKVTLAKQIVFR